MNRSDLFCVVLVTAASQPDAVAIAHALVSRKLAACVNLVPVQSIYTWDGSVQEDNEWQLLIKTRRERLDALEHVIHDLHAYDVPEMIVLPIIQGAQPYLQWMSEMTEPPQP